MPVRAEAQGRASERSGRGEPLPWGSEALRQAPDCLRLADSDLPRCYLGVSEGEGAKASFSLSGQCVHSANPSSSDASLIQAVIFLTLPCC